jgi:hypothetical protein
MSANRAPGVIELIRFGDDHPARVPEAEIELLKARRSGGDVIHLPPPPPPMRKRRFVKGDKLRVTAYGATFAAIHTGTSRRDLERVLLAVLGATREVDVPRHLIMAAG